MPTLLGAKSQAKACGYIISLILFFLCSPSDAGTWAKTFGGAIDELVMSIQQTSDGGYILTGMTNSYGAGGSDVLVLRLDSGGNIVWQKTFGGASTDFGRSILGKTLTVITL